MACISHSAIKINRRQLHLVYSDESVKARTEGVLEVIVAQLKEPETNTTNALLLRKALRYRNRAEQFGGEHHDEHVAARFGITWHKATTVMA
ncbi:hypothetical protein ACHHYP_12079 [Achlya hypogyna]|uniref:Uncharacterized protein n=1 Tax=Achlya hypogyna TaxID=1202772 RepID=A0A1V9YHN4_ACHHY|nr:hypothetical protein ACHHYP_12079 [Achlya hypogyna]